MKNIVIATLAISLIYCVALLHKNAATVKIMGNRVIISNAYSGCFRVPSGDVGISWVEKE